MKSRYLLVLALMAGLFGLYQSSVNARTAASMRDKIVAGDEAGHNVTADLNMLETFSHAHSHANVRLELTGSYNRAVAAAQPAVPTGEMYAQAQAACSGRANSIVQAKCVTDYVSKRLPPPAAPVAAPDRALFVKEYHSPAWAPDASGLGYLGAVVLVMLAATLHLFRRMSR